MHCIIWMHIRTRSACRTLYSGISCVCVCVCLCVWMGMCVIYGQIKLAGHVYSGISSVCLCVCLRVCVSVSMSVHMYTAVYWYIQWYIGVSVSVHMYTVVYRYIQWYIGPTYIHVYHVDRWTSCRKVCVPSRQTSSSASSAKYSTVYNKFTSVTHHCQVHIWVRVKCEMNESCPHMNKSRPRMNEYRVRTLLNTKKSGQPRPPVMLWAYIIANLSPAGGLGRMCLCVG